MGFFTKDLNGHSVRDGALGDLRDEHRIVTLGEEKKLIEDSTFEDVLKLLHWFKPEYRWVLLRKP